MRWSAMSDKERISAHCAHCDVTLIVWVEKVHNGTRDGPVVPDVSMGHLCPVQNYFIGLEEMEFKSIEES